MKWKDKSKIGMGLLILGFIIILINAVDYLGGFFGLSSEIHLPSSGFGIILVALGMYLSKKKK